jgi:hypothetical protein
MAAGYAVALRNAQLDAIVTFAGAGALLRIYNGARPATGGTATTLLAELTCGATLGTVADGVLTFGSVTQDSSANNAGDASWFRIVKSDGTTHVMDGTVTVTGGGGQMEVVSLTITSGQPVSLSSFTITRGNA